jgi:eukaryotic-like serine/threonine-protein kinase
MNTSDAIITSLMFQIGDQIDRFQINDHIAQGGMSNIYRAYDIVSRREVAIKIPDKSMIGDPAQFERFQREMEVTQQLKHPAVLQGLYAGQYNRVPYLVTEMVTGESLRQLIDTSAPIPVDQTFSLIKKIAEGMSYCHQNYVIHRDLKPENILITEDGQPVIMDFGLALTKSSHRVTYSNLSVTMGTPDYMAPEQVEGQRGDARSDIYALGIIIFEMLNGKPPFFGDNNLAVMAQRLNNDAPRLDKLSPDVTPQVAAIVARCLTRDPKDRYPDMLSLIEDIDHPENVDISILSKLHSDPVRVRWWSSSAARMAIISLLVLTIIVALAFTLQYLKQ